MKNTVLGGERLAVPSIEPRCEELPERTRVHADFLQRSVENERIRNTGIPEPLLDSGVEQVQLVLGKPAQRVAEEPSRSEYVYLVDGIEEGLQAAQDCLIVFACLLVRKRLRKAEGQEDALNDIEGDRQIVGDL